MLKWRRELLASKHGCGKGGFQKVSNMFCWLHRHTVRNTEHKHRCVSFMKRFHTVSVKSQQHKTSCVNYQYWVAMESNRLYGICSLITDWLDCHTYWQMHSLSGQRAAMNTKLTYFIWWCWYANMLAKYLERVLSCHQWHDSDLAGYKVLAPTSVGIT